MSSIAGPTDGGPYNLELLPEDGGWRFRFGDGRLVIRCEAFDLGEFGTVRSPELEQFSGPRTDEAGAP